MNRRKPKGECYECGAHFEEHQKSWITCNICDSLKRKAKLKKQKRYQENKKKLSKKRFDTAMRILTDIKNKIDRELERRERIITRSKRYIERLKYKRKEIKLKYLDLVDLRDEK